MTVTVLLSASPELLSRFDALVSVLTGITGVEKVRSVKVRPEDGCPNEPIKIEKKQTKKKTETLIEDISEGGRVLTGSEAVETTGVNETVAREEKSTETEAPLYTLEQVRAAAQEKAQEGKRAELKALITEMGAPNLPSLEPSKFNEFMSKLSVL